MMKQIHQAVTDSAKLCDNDSIVANIPTENNLDSLVANTNLKFIFVGGKGGVGKTTSSAAIATQLSFDRKVLLVSTDPAHSLSDAFRCNFGADPISPNRAALPNLDVMEVDPKTTVDDEISSWTALVKEFPGADDITEKIKSFQEWITGIPGIDEATALASAISHIESGKYDIIVFDTAPTGHTLKLLALPDVIQVGIEKLESWQSTIWGYWETVKGFGGSTFFINAAKKAVAGKLKTYKQGIEKVANMLQDHERTRFVVICIAEYLSICETRRLLQELKKCKVTASHIIVNQLVNDSVTPAEMERITTSLAGSEHAEVTESDLRKKVIRCCQLMSSRNAIQTKYLKELRSYPEVGSKDSNIAVIEVPLLPSEVTGHEAILEFSRLMVSNSKEEKEHFTIESLPETRKHDRRANNKVERNENGQNFSTSMSELPEKKSRDNGGNLTAEEEKAKRMLDQLLQDPEIAKMLVGKNRELPFKLGEAVKDVMANPMNFLKYMMDPEMAPIIQIAMKKFKDGSISDLLM